MEKLSIHAFIHVAFEGLGCIEQWIKRNNHLLSYTNFYEDHQLPDVNEMDWLIIMGGPMAVYDEKQYPWLVEEKAFIRTAINSGKAVIGICLGSQLLAEVLGANVYPNHQKEIGWFDIKLSQAAKKIPLINSFEERFPVFHWHGDTFDLPTGSIHLMNSVVTENQAFLFKDNVLGLQFHFEVTNQSLKGMVDNEKDELVESDTIQSAEKILEHTDFIEGNNRKMFQILDYLEKNQEPRAKNKDKRAKNKE